jgi:histidyl-tRNA synthetase
MTYRAPKGTDDILAPESRRWRRLLRAWDEMTERYGYELILTPIFESTDLFARGVGAETEVVEKQMYTFADKSGRSLTLRPEQTASVVRAYLQAGKQGVMKVAYSGPMFRYEQPQAGRRRQFYQLGVEYLGVESVDADVEVIELGYRFLRAAGLEDVEVQLNSIGDAADRANYRAVLSDYLRDRAADLSADARRRIETNPLRVLDSKQDAAVVADAPAPLDYLAAERRAEFDAVRRGLGRLGIPVTVAPRLVRGLDYYNRTVFEYVPRTYEAAQNAVGGGGRYDPLAAILGGRETPGIGLSLGLDRIIVALGEEAVAAPALDVFVVVAGSHWDEAVGLVGRLREGGLRADLDLGRGSVKAQFKQADRRAAAGVIIVGDEWEDGRVTGRDLESGTQELIAAEEIMTWVRRR